MALYWYWNKDRIGCMWKRGTDGRLVQTDLYKGNAMMIEVYIDGDEFYLHSFFIDKEHAENCLGLTAGYENIFADCEDLSVELWGTDKNTIELATLFMKAGITVEYRKEKNI